MKLILILPSHLRLGLLSSLFPLRFPHKNYVYATHLPYKSKARWLTPDGVIRNFHLHNLSDRSMTLGWIQPLTEMSIRSISWRVKAAGA